MKVSATILFWVGCIITILAAGLQLIIPGIQLVLLLLAVVGVALAVWQKYRGDQEQQHLFEQERKKREAAEQAIYDCTPEGEHRRNRERLLNQMYMGSQDPYI